MGKRGSLELQFNWIFVLIIGAVILLFFYMLTNRGMDATKRTVDANVVKTMENIFTTFSTNPEDTIKTIELPSRTELNFVCNDYDGSSAFSVGDYSQDIKNQIYFSPDYFMGDVLTVWTKKWRIPFFVVNFLYVTSPDARYIFVNDTSAALGGLMKGLYDEMKDMHEGETTVQYFRKDFVQREDYPDILNKNNQKVRIVFMDGSAPDNWPYIPSELANDPDVGVTALEISPQAGGFSGWGKVTFYRESLSVFEESGVSYYLGEESLLGAMFSEDGNMYNCSMRKALERVGKLADVYIDRSNNMSQYLTANPGLFNGNCRTDFNNAKYVYEKMAEHTYLNEGNITELYDYGLYPMGDYSLTRLGTVARDHSCGELY